MHQLEIWFFLCLSFCLSASPSVSLCVSLCLSLSVSLYICIYLNICIYIHIYMDIYTYIRILKKKMKIEKSSVFCTICIWGRTSFATLFISARSFNVTLCVMYITFHFPFVVQMLPIKPHLWQWITITRLRDAFNAPKLRLASIPTTHTRTNDGTVSHLSWRPDIAKSAVEIIAYTGTNLIQTFMKYNTFETMRENGREDVLCTMSHYSDVIISPMASQITGANR